MNSQEMMRMNCGKGNHFENISKLGDIPNWVIVKGIIDTVDLNAKFTIFGYDQDEFMAKQYMKNMQITPLFRRS